MIEQEGNNGKYEKAWKDALGDASATPPARVWDGIDKSLTETQLVALQKKTVIYKWAVAASVILAASLGVLALSYEYPFLKSWFAPEIIAQIEDPNASSQNIDQGNFAGFSILKLDGETKLAEETPGQDDIQHLKTADVSVSDRIASGANSVEEPPADKAKVDNRVQMSILDRRSTSPVNGTSSGKIVSDDLFSSPITSREVLAISQSGFERLPVDAVDPSAIWINRVPVDVVKSNSKSGNGRFWCGVDVASGYFNPNYQPGVTLSSQELLIKGVGSREPIPELSENMRGGASYSFGINFGMNLKKRWSLEVGAQYSLLGARTFTNLILESEGFNKAVAYSSEIAGLESVANLVESELTKLSVDDIQVSNTFQFMSFPVQAGYKLLDKRFNVTLNAGLAANLYLGNSLRGKRDFTSFELQPGRRSPYRSLTLAGIAGFEMGYWIHPRVNVSFEPTYQKNLQSLTKDDSGFVANPSGVGVQIGFKYDF